jgi:hypothetical protein
MHKSIVIFTFIIGMVSSALAVDRNSCDDYRGTKCYYNGDIAADYAYEYGKKKTYPFYDFTNIGGGDCTNFASQAILAGLTGVTDPTDLKPLRLKYLADRGHGYNLAWYYYSVNDRGSAFTGADWLYKYAKSNKTHYKGLHFKFITKDSKNTALNINLIKKGDIIFADWEGDGVIDHTMIVTEKTPGNYYSSVKVAYHNQGQHGVYSNRRLSDINALHIVFYVYRPTFYSDYGL